MRIAVIGGGAAGLCAARHSVRCLGGNPSFSLSVFEQTSSVGGTWVYSEKTGMDDNRLPIMSSMYKHMKTNLPKEVMAFPGAPFDAEFDSFVGHARVLRYLEQYAEKYDLLKFINFNTHVTKLRHSKEKNTFTIETETFGKHSPPLHSSAEFDAVVVCNGHYSTPSSPVVEGETAFKGTRTHSHNYRSSKPFAGSTVVCVGAGPSGVDIACELAAVCPKVYLCHSHARLTSSMPSNVQQCGTIVRYAGDGVTTAEGEVLKVDHVIYCTGYTFTFPFIDKETIRLSVENNRITPLYRHLLHCDYPRQLFFVGLPITVCPFPLFDVQCRVLCQFLSNNAELPDDLRSWEGEDFALRRELGERPHYAHKLGGRQWEYMYDMCKMVNIECPFPPAIERLYLAVGEERRKHLGGYKTQRWRIVDEVNVQRIS